MPATTTNSFLQLQHLYDVADTADISPLRDAINIQARETIQELREKYPDLIAQALLSETTFPSTLREAIEKRDIDGTIDQLKDLGLFGRSKSMDVLKAFLENFFAAPGKPLRIAYLRRAAGATRRTVYNTINNVNAVTAKTKLSIQRTGNGWYTLVYRGVVSA